MSVRCLALLSAVALLGCGKSCKSDRPYVPYAVGDAPSTSTGGGAPSTSGTLLASAAPDDAGVLAEPALAAPAGATQWSVEGVDLTAPPGREFAFAIVRDIDDDGKTDAVAVVKPKVDPGDKRASASLGEIVFYAGERRGQPPEVLAAAQPSRIDASCTPVLRFGRASAREAVAEIGSTCAQGPSSRSIIVVRLARSPSVVYDLVLRDVPGAPKLSVDVDTRDRDHDGVDDVALNVTIEGGAPPFEPGPKLSATIAYFDRPAGPSRDPDEPEASFRAIASQAAVRAQRAKDAATVPVLVDQMRALYRAMCTEGGGARLTTRSGAGAISCGSSKALEDAFVAEVRAWVTQGDALRALLAAEGAQRPPASKSAARTTELGKLLGQVAPLVQARSARVLRGSLESRAPAHPSWGSLSFDPAGNLLVRTDGKVLSIDPESFEATETEESPWTTQVLSPDGKSRWLEAYHACEAVPERATLAPTGGDGDLRDVVLPVVPTFGTRCTGSRASSAKVLPIAWGPRGLEAIVSGVPVLIPDGAASASVLLAPLDQAPPRGSSRSPGGKVFAMPARDGVLVRGPKSVRVQARELEPYESLRGCTVADDAAHLACEKDGKPVLVAF